MSSLLMSMGDIDYRGGNLMTVKESPAWSPANTSHLGLTATLHCLSQLCPLYHIWQSLGFNPPVPRLLPTDVDGTLVVTCAQNVKKKKKLLGNSD